MKIKILIFLFSFTILNFSYCQELIYTSNYSFLGYKSDQPVFEIYSIPEAVNNGIYFLDKGNYELYGFKLVEELIVKGYLVFVNNTIVVTESYDDTLKGRWVYVYNNDILLDSIITHNEFEVSFSVSENILFISVGTELYSKLAYIDLNLQHPKIKLLPLFANRHYVLKDWLYFSYSRVNYGYSPYPDDIFRVKINDWQNPKLVFRNTVSEYWFLYPDSHVLFNHVDLGKEKSDFDILFNSNSLSYQEIKIFGLGFTEFINIHDQYFFLRKKKTKGFTAVDLIPLPELPLQYPYKDTRRILPREIWYNVPLKEKSFKGTFITSELLRQALREELEKLEKPQLRLLRNAIYAQQAYIFESKDLQDFFNQFEWYRMMTNKKTSNEDVVILPEDKERANLILEIEQSK